MKKLSILAGWIVAGLATLTIGAFLIWRMFFVTNVEKHEFAFSFNRRTGEIDRIERSGWITRWPWVETIHTIDTRPYQISINADINNSGFGVSSISRRVLNAKLVRFNPAGLKTFIEWHGRSAGDRVGGMLEILKAYAFDQADGRDCPFLTIEAQLSPKQIATNSPVR